MLHLFKSKKRRKEEELHKKMVRALYHWRAFLSEEENPLPDGNLKQYNKRVATDLTREIIRDLK